jgi:hypothetical protein
MGNTSRCGNAQTMGIACTRSTMHLSRATVSKQLKVKNGTCLRQVLSLSPVSTKKEQSNVKHGANSVVFRELTSCHLRPSSSSSSQVTAIEILTPLSPKPVILVLVYISPSSFANDIDLIVQSLVNYESTTNKHTIQRVIVLFDFVFLSFLIITTPAVNTVTDV